MAVLGEAATGREAVEMARRLKPDLISMDVMLPDLDGFEATRAILADGPARIVMVSAAGEALQADLSFRALQCGALDLVEKPEARDPEGLAQWGRALAERLTLLAAQPLGRRALGHQAAFPSRPFRAPHRVAAFGIAVSTGGPPALAQLLKSLAPSLNYPVLVAQHIAPGFAPGLARWLAGQTQLPVRLAESGELPTPGVVWLAKDRTDLVLTGDGRLCAAPNGQRDCAPTGTVWAGQPGLAAGPQLCRRGAHRHGRGRGQGPAGHEEGGRPDLRPGQRQLRGGRHAGRGRGRWRHGASLELGRAWICDGRTRPMTWRPGRLEEP